MKHQDLKNKLYSLMLGTGSAQLISLIIVFLLTYLYTPVEFKDYAIFVGVVSVLSSISCLKYEIAIPLVDDKDIIDILYLCFLINTVFSLLISLFLSALFYIFKWDVILLLLLIITIFFVGFYNILFNLALKEKDFKSISYSRIKQAIFGGIIQISMAIVGLTKYGLQVGNFFNFTAGLKVLSKNLDSKVKKTNIKKIKKIAFKYINYPKYSTFDAFFNQATQHVPTIIMGFLYGNKAGLFMLCMRILLAPVGLVGNNLQSLYLSEVSSLKNKFELSKLSKSIVIKCFNLGVIPMLIVSLLCYMFLDNILSDSWRGISDMIVLCTPWIIFFLITRPLTVYLNYIGKQKINFLFNLLFFLIGCSILFYGSFNNDFNGLILFFFVNFILYSSFYYYISIHCRFNSKRMNFTFLLMLILFLGSL